jgi:hypothetical protein
MIGGGGKEGDNPFRDKGGHYRIFIKNGFPEGIVPPVELLEIPFPDKESHILAAKPDRTQGGSREDRPPGLKEFVYFLESQSGHSTTLKTYRPVNMTIHFECILFRRMRQAPSQQ